LLPLTDLQRLYAAFIRYSGRQALEVLSDSLSFA